MKKQMFLPSNCAPKATRTTIRTATTLVTVGFAEHRLLMWELLRFVVPAEIPCRLRIAFAIAAVARAGCSSASRSMKTMDEPMSETMKILREIQDLLAPLPYVRRSHVLDLVMEYARLHAHYALDQMQARLDPLWREPKVPETKEEK